MKHALAAAAIALFVFGACKSAESRDDKAAERTVKPPPPKKAPELPPEAPLEDLLDLPAEATAEMVGKRLDRAFELMDAMFETIAEHADDCDRMATSLERFVEVNHRMIRQLRKLEDHKELLEGQLKPKVDAWIQKWMPTITKGLTACMSNKRVMKVFEELSKEE